jgi:hypothetical protein
MGNEMLLTTLPTVECTCVDCVEADEVSSLALKLEIAMACDDDARARYEVIYGRPWVGFGVQFSGRATRGMDAQSAAPNDGTINR